MGMSIRQYKVKKEKIEKQNFSYRRFHLEVQSFCKQSERIENDRFCRKNTWKYVLGQILSRTCNY